MQTQSVSIVYGTSLVRKFIVFFYLNFIKLLLVLLVLFLFTAFSAVLFLDIIPIVSTFESEIRGAIFKK